MARINGQGESTVLHIREFLGLNENPDGDTHLRPGELAVLRNFRITRDRHLQLRPGWKTIMDLHPFWLAWPGHTAVAAPRLCGVWQGRIGGKEHLLCAYGGAILDVDFTGKTAVVVGQCTQDETSFFGFSDRVYLLNGHEYLNWDGSPTTQFQPVEGYIPTIYTACTPGGDGQKLEGLNRLTGKRRVRFSADGGTNIYHLPETEIDELLQVKIHTIPYPLEALKVDKKTGIITFNGAPGRGTSNLEITYRKGNGNRAEVEKMHYAELYNGATDARVFLYGDGTNRALYSGVDLDKSTATADYFPDLYEAAVGDANAPITGMVRHYARLLVFKTESAWSVDYDTMMVPGGGITSAFRVLPVNRNLGNAALGQVRLLENDPLTLAGGCIYQWQIGAGSMGDNRAAQRISDRVHRTLGGFDLAQCRTFNRWAESEFWVRCQDKALIYNYGNDCWYLYDNMDFQEMWEAGGQTYAITAAGRIVHISRRYRNDDGAPIRAEAESGAMDFGRDWMHKVSPVIYVALQPESGGRVRVTAQTNRRGDYPEKLVSAGFATLSHVDFAHWSFGTNRKPQVRRVKMPVSRATFYKLVFRSDSASAAGTVLETDIWLRFAGKVR